MTANTVAMTAGYMDNTGAITASLFGGITGTNGVSLIAGSAGDISLDGTQVTSSTSADMVLSAQSGSIAHTVGLLTANNLTVEAESEVSLRTNVIRLNTDISGTGNLTISELNGIELDAITLADGDFELAAAGTILSTGTTTANHLNIHNKANGDISLMTEIGVLTLNQDGIGDVSIDEDSGIEVDSAEILDGSLTIDAAGNIILNEVNLESNSDDNDVTITTTAGNIGIGILESGIHAADEAAAVELLKELSIGGVIRQKMRRL